MVLKGKGVGLLQSYFNYRQVANYYQLGQLSLGKYNKEKKKSHPSLELFELQMILGEKKDVRGCKFSSRLINGTEL